MPPSDPAHAAAPSSVASQGPVNVLLIGGGAREASIAWKLWQSPRLGELYVTDAANPGLAAIAKAAGVAVDPKDYFPVRTFCQKNSIGLVVIGPEDPLAAGLTDALMTPVFPGAPVPLVFGPSKAAAQLEGDKAFAKQVMHSASIPTAEARTFSNAEDARQYVESRSEPHVIKAAGLCKGKGVVVPSTKAEALAAIDRMMVKREFGDAGRTVVIEERLKGREVSVLALVDGRNIFVMEPCQDHKRLGDGATGPNTGGMGSICPPPKNTVSERMLASIERDVLVPTIDSLRRDGIEYRGVLYAGLMLTPAGPKVLEFNCRFGDPECQVLMRRLRGDLLEIFIACATRRLHEVPIAWEPGAAVCVVLASQGYPDNPKPGAVISGIDEANAQEGVVVFHAGAKRDERGNVVAAGGRVLSVTAIGADADAARKRAYRGVERIAFEGRTLRTDIGTDVVG